MAETTDEDEERAVLAEQLRRRHEAALRLPPLPCGRRDPLERHPRDAAVKQ